MHICDDANKLITQLLGLTNNIYLLHFWKLIDSLNCGNILKLTEQIDWRKLLDCGIYNIF